MRGCTGQKESKSLRQKIPAVFVDPTDCSYFLRSPRRTTRIHLSKGPAHDRKSGFVLLQLSVLSSSVAPKRFQSRLLQHWLHYARRIVSHPSLSPRADALTACLSASENRTG
jgi:hypothetical protein